MNVYVKFKLQKIYGRSIYLVWKWNKIHWDQF